MTEKLKPIDVSKYCVTEFEEEAINYLLKRLSIDIDEFEKWIENARGEVKFAVDCYVAGAKAHSIEWHNLRENPNDLPKKDCEVIVLHENGRKHIQKWADGNWVNAIVVPVITWCEIPKYTEE